MKSIKSTAGFTLLELMVTTSLIIIISAAMFVNLRDYNSSKQLDLAGNEFVFQAERMRNFAQTGKKFNNSVPSGGWGVHFSSGTDKIEYTLFADTNNDGLYAPGEQFSVTSLSNTVYFRSVSGATSPVTIVYKPSYGDYFLNGTDSSPEIFITLGLPKKTEKRTITVRRISGALELSNSDEEI
ncbi:MAG: hypothetical protein HOJ15_00550 [Candidatus Jacksonbacteria bacterium]|jgi:type II secretory pathway pseudopilin PulG|nr:hypothetical protein [Candidatus Jacksonbacteria bacterium]MBT7007911.1 hypothetical protein [Candidatus Jacksonbacteria bacterium]MBT7338481.1 hypothetical protein [Candidatus Jacksonbacteria bacterium]